jgi:hypothetical protein
LYDNWEGSIKAANTLQHNANLRETLHELFETCSGSGEVFARPSSELVEGLKPIGARIYSPYQSI